MQNAITELTERNIAMEKVVLEIARQRKVDATAATDDLPRSFL